MCRQLQLGHHRVLQHLHHQLEVAGGRAAVVQAGTVRLDYRVDRQTPAFADWRHQNSAKRVKKLLKLGKINKP